MRTLLAVLDPLAAVAALHAIGVREPEVLLLAAGVSVLAASGLHVHRSRLVLSMLDDLPRVVALTGVVLGVVVVLGPHLAPVPEVLDERIAAVAALHAALLLLARALVYAATHRARRRGRVSHDVVVVGTDVVARRVTEALVRHREHGLRPVGVLSPDGSVPLRPAAPYVGPLAALPRVLHDLEVRHVVVAFGDAPSPEVVRAVRRAVAENHQVFVVPRFFEAMSRRHATRTELVHGVALTRLPRLSEWSVGRVAKRGLDVVLAGAALVALAPLLAVCGLAARRETGGVLFRQTRVGLHGRTFTLYKLQTLRPAPAAGETWNIDNDARLGPTGRFLRRTGLDELPQLVNVLRGDMSLVGPRPERPHYATEFARRHHGYDDRHRVPVGITGWAQVHHLRGDTSISERVRFDNAYIDSWSLWRDITILARTLPTMRRAQPTARDAVAVVRTAGSAGSSGEVSRVGAGPGDAGRSATAPPRRRRSRSSAPRGRVRPRPRRRPRAGARDGG